MHKKFWAVFVILGLALAVGAISADNGPYAKFEQLSLSQVEITRGFWGARREQLEKTVLPTQWEQLESHHDIDNFRVLAGLKTGTHFGPVYLDSDLYKWLEAASYVSGKHPEDKLLADRVAEVVGLIAKVQMPDGYVNTYYETFAPDRRWTNLVMNHELYCSGHLIEAAVANKEATGKDDLLKVAVKLADHITNVFGPGKNLGVPGHEEVELALVRLYRQTGDKKYLEQANWFINERGRFTKYPQATLNSLRDQSSLAKIVNAKRRKFAADAPKAGTASGFLFETALLDPRIPGEFLSGKYFQDDNPFVDLTVAEGHAVRAMYYFTGATDVYLETGNQKLLDAAERIWDNTITKRTYITGGMGSLPGTEGFGRDYELPNRSYTETCAAIGSFFWNWRMLRATGDAKYADLMEKTLYNAIIPAISLDGTRYFYQNQLTSSGKDARQSWYETACCPPNIARLLGSLERYLYGQSVDGIWVHQYISGSARFERGGKKLKIDLESWFPWSGDVKIKITADQPALFSLMLRIPSWAQNTEVKINGQAAAEKAEPGKYLRLSREWKNGDVITITFPFEVRVIDPQPQVKEDRGKIAIMRGPLIYCLECKDNSGMNTHKAVLSKSAKITIDQRNDLLGGVVLLKAKSKTGKDLVLIPYYAWSNRGPSYMDVWIKAQ
jgi:hypothetical protein